MQQVDLVIIGAGIHGAAVARQAALEGYRALVIEQYDQVAQGTSSRSSKLIHGGLRYLESAQFRLVRECLHERKVLLKTAASLVELVPFFIPVYKQNKRSRWKIAAGLVLYWLLGGGKFKRIARCDWNKLDGIKTENLQTVFQYFDAQTDDVELTQAIMTDAKKHGCQLQTAVKVVQIEMTGQPKLTLDNGDTIAAKLIINTSGPWINQVMQTIKPPEKIYPVELVQGAHIIVQRRLTQGIYYLEAPDARVVFAMPWKGQVMIGTTETIYSGDPSEVRPLAAETEYLLSIWNDYFSDHLVAEQVTHAFAGLRVLPVSAQSAFSRARDTQLITTNRMISVVGGKLTSHRHTAERVMDIVHQTIKPQRRINTAVLKIVP